jgi:hypothetical protein
LDPVPINPIRNVVSFAVDNQQLLKPLSSEPLSKLPPVELCAIKRNSISLFALREKLILRKVRETAVSKIIYINEFPRTFLFLMRAR